MKLLLFFQENTHFIIQNWYWKLRYFPVHFMKVTLSHRITKHSPNTLHSYPFNYFYCLSPTHLQHLNCSHMVTCWVSWNGNNFCYFKHMFHTYISNYEICMKIRDTHMPVLFSCVLSCHSAISTFCFVNQITSIWIKFCFFFPEWLSDRPLRQKIAFLEFCAIYIITG